MEWVLREPGGICTLTQGPSRPRLPRGSAASEVSPQVRRCRAGVLECLFCAETHRMHLAVWFPGRRSPSSFWLFSPRASWSCTLGLCGQQPWHQPQPTGERFPKLSCHLLATGGGDAGRSHACGTRQAWLLPRTPCRTVNNDDDPCSGSGPQAGRPAAVPPSLRRLASSMFPGPLTNEVSCPGV